jgi:GTPase SAR1 family protein
MKLLLSYFDQLIGPKVLISSADLEKPLQSRIISLMDINQDQGYFEHVFTNEKESEIFIANYAFIIPSEWSRGKIDRLMVSYISSPDEESKHFKSLVEEFIAKLKRQTSIYKALYIRSTHKDPEIDLYYELLDAFFSELRFRIEDSAKESIVGEIFFFGQSAAGKTSILNRLAAKEFKADTLKDIGIKIMHISWRDLKFLIYDIGGTKELKRLWLDSSSSPDAIVYVIALAVNEEQMQDVVQDFGNIMEQYYSTRDLGQRVPLLLLANKVDLQKSWNEQRVQDLFHPEAYAVKFHIGFTSARENVGITTNMQWLVEQFTTGKVISRTRFTNRFTKFATKF